MCPFQPEHPLALWSYRAGEIFASISLTIFTLLLLPIYASQRKRQYFHYFFEFTADLAHLSCQRLLTVGTAISFFFIGLQITKNLGEGAVNPTEVNSVALNDATLMQINGKPLIYY